MKWWTNEQWGLICKHDTTMQKYLLNPLALLYLIFSDSNYYALSFLLLWAYDSYSPSHNSTFTVNLVAGLFIRQTSHTVHKYRFLHSASSFIPAAAVRNTFHRKPAKFRTAIVLRLVRRIGRRKKAKPELKMTAVAPVHAVSFYILHLQHRAYMCRRCLSSGQPFSKAESLKADLPQGSDTWRTTGLSPVLLLDQFTHNRSSVWAVHRHPADPQQQICLMYSIFNFPL